MALAAVLVLSLLASTLAGFTWPHQCPAWKRHSAEHEKEACPELCGTVHTPPCAQCPQPLALNRFKMCAACGAHDQPSCVDDGFVYACCAQRAVAPAIETLPIWSVPNASAWGELRPRYRSHRPRYWRHRAQSVDAAVPCGNPFGGCSTYRERRQALSCLFSATSEDPLAPTELECGFVYESVYDAVLERTAANPACHTVVFTVNFGAYDHVRATNVGAVPPATCFFLFVDAVTEHGLADELAALRAAEPFWTVVLVPSFPISAQKTARTLKVLAHRFFPHARRSLYFDAKVVFRDTVFRFLADCLSRGEFVGEFGRHDGTADEVDYTYGLLVNRIQRGTSRPADLDELNLQAQQYRLEGYQDRGLRMNTIYLARNHTAEVKLLECAWFDEVDYFSHREQVSLPHAAAAVGLSHIVHRRTTLTKCGASGISQFKHLRANVTSARQDC